MTTTAPQDHSKHGRSSRSKAALIAVMVSAAILSGCSMFDWMKGDRSKSDNQERYDDAPLTQETGSLPGDRSNAEYTDEDLKAE